MSKYNKTVLTNAGIDLAKKVNAGRAKFSITKAATSSENLSDKSIADLQNMTELPSIMQYGLITDVEDSALDKDTVIGMDLKFNNKELAHGYSVNAIGLYAKEDGGNEFLYAIATAVDPEHMPDFNNKAMFQFNITMYVVVGQSSSVTINVTEEGVATKQDLAAVEVEVGKKANATDVYDKTTINQKFGLKANKTDVTNQINQAKGEAEKYAYDQAKINDDNFKALKQRVDTDETTKANKADVYNKQEVDDKVAAAGKVKSVNGGMGDVQLGGTNLFIKSTLQHGWLDHTAQGGVQYSEVDYHTDYIWVNGKSKFTLIFYQPSEYVKSHYTNAQIDFYDENQSWIGRVDTGNGWIVEADDIWLPFSLADGTFWLRVSINYGSTAEKDSSKTKLEYGTVVTDWSPAPEDMISDKDFEQFKQDNQNALNSKATPNDVAQAENRANAHADSVAGTAQSNAQNYTSSQLANYYNKQQADNALTQKAPSTVDGHDVAHLLHNFVSLWGGDAEREPQINGNSTHFFDQIELVGRVLTASGFFSTDSNNFTFPIRKDDGSYSNEQLATALKLISEYVYAAKGYTDTSVNAIPRYSENLLINSSTYLQSIGGNGLINETKVPAAKGDKFSIGAWIDNTKDAGDDCVAIWLYDAQDTAIAVAKGNVIAAGKSGYSNVTTTISYDQTTYVTAHISGTGTQYKEVKLAKWENGLPPNMTYNHNPADEELDANLALDKAKKYADSAATSAQNNANSYTNGILIAPKQDISNLKGRVTALENREYAKDAGTDADALTYSQAHPSVIVFGD
ncbi:hypothetical protein PT287_09065 [Lactobacillus sp. ESL0679]|uniref:hypothetical protein n=1 Tax=Lactobacillus sp. ESL0679 TaxID=2983209 RepID=UPI0023FA2276|nr:hypothetical protein [Lactobacillus sp. ESL0679]MDF7683645.1 hypothetical protein [Lactobacillus sp. ESL0679]